MTKNIVKFFIIWVVTYILFILFQSNLSSLISNIFGLIFSGIESSSLNIEFSEENSHIKTIIFNKLSEVKYYWFSLDTKLHFIAPFSFLLALVSSVKSKNRVKLFAMATTIFMLFFTFKAYLMIQDHLIRETFLSNGEVISVLKNPSINELTIKSLNEIINTKAPIYTRYFASFGIFLLSFTYLNKIKLRKFNFKNMF